MHGQLVSRWLIREGAPRNHVFCGTADYPVTGSALRSNWDRTPGKPRIHGGTGAPSAGSRYMIPKLRCLTVPVLGSLLSPKRVETGQKEEPQQTFVRHGFETGIEKGRGMRKRKETYRRELDGCPLP